MDLEAIQMDYVEVETEVFARRIEKMIASKAEELNLMLPGRNDSMSDGSGAQPLHASV